MNAVGASSALQDSVFFDNTTTKCSTDVDLAVFSPSDAPWDVHRAEADDVAMIYAGVYQRYAERVSQCSSVLRFSIEDGFKLKSAAFCRVRYCPVCQWRRSLMWRARFYASMPALEQQFPRARWLFLTLTVRNCRITELGDTLTVMSKAWDKLRRRKELAPVLGWVRATEVTRSSDGSAHPHYHALLMVPPRWFSGQSYVKQARWAELWRESLGVDYQPMIDIRAVRGRSGDESPMQRAILETLKYSVKASDMTTDEAWFLELTRQTHKRRFIAAGGALKTVLRPDDEDDEALALTDGEGGVNGPKIAFSWRSSAKRYKRAPKLDQPF